MSILRTVRDACELQESALDYAMGDTVEHLSDLLDQTEKHAEAFFEKNWVTGGMRQLLRLGLQRLAGQSEQAVFELKQAMGGGKTHSMLALGLLARNPQLRNRVAADITAGIPSLTARVVAINGRTVSDDVFIWGDIARQLGLEAEFARFWKEGARAPSETDWAGIIGDQPVLILLDELPPYFDYAITRIVGGGTLANVTTYALSNLLSAALKLKRCCIVVSNLSGVYEGASRQLGQAIRNFQQEAGRQVKPITPVELASDEIYQILKKRLFKRLPDPDDGVIDAVASAYGAALTEAAKAKAVAKSAELVAEEVHASYPFHPSVKNVIALFKENESYRQTRGLMLFVSKMLKSVWERPTNDVYLIGCQHLDLALSDVREEINRISNLQGAISTDICSQGAAHAEVIDANMRSDAGSQVARLLLTASLSESVDAVKGFTKEQAVECLVAPNRTALEFDEAFESLRKEAWYLHRKENDAYYFSNVENLRKRIESRAITAPQPKIDAELKRRLENVFAAAAKNAYQEIVALPRIDEIRVGGARVCMVMSPDSKTPPQEAQRFWEAVVEKNNFCVVTGDGSSLGNLEDKARRIWAVAKVRDEVGPNSPHLLELEEESQAAEFDFNSAVVNLFNRVYYPARTPSGSQLAYVRLQLSAGDEGLNGERQVEEALASTAASKLKLEVEVEADSLIQRAEDQLWQGEQKRIPWADVLSRAKANPRWPWLPPKGLEQLRKIACAKDRWRWTDDGYIEKGPFPPPRTSVVILEKDYDERTGNATLEVTASAAGPKGRVHFSLAADVSVSSPTLEDVQYQTDATAVWFLAVDPDHKHETGEPKRWTNKLKLTHQPRVLPGKRLVELKVVPRGSIRWNMTGANPKDGAPYESPIEIAGNTEVVIYAYAEDQGVSTTAQFRILATGKESDRLDPDRPARLKKRLNLDGTGAVFAFLKDAKSVQARFGARSVEIGQGADNVRMAFGSESIMSPDAVERLIAAARDALGSDGAEVRMGVNEVRFQTGRDLETFVKMQSIDVNSGEVDQ